MGRISPTAKTRTNSINLQEISNRYIFCKNHIHIQQLLVIQCDLPNCSKNVFVFNFLKGRVAEDQKDSENQAHQEVEGGKEEKEVASKSKNPRKNPRCFLQLVNGYCAIENHTFHNPVFMELDIESVKESVEP